MKAKINLKNVLAYIQGNVRYWIYYSKYFKWLMRRFIREQISARIESMERECYDNGICKLCGCSTTALQMSNKPCDKPCYPKMMSRNLWKAFKAGTLYHQIEARKIWLYKKSNKFKSINLEDYVGNKNCPIR